MSEMPLSQSLLQSNGFRFKIRELAAHTVRRDMPGIEASTHESAIPWNYLLMAASSLTGVQTEPAQDAALRIAQACLSEQGTTIPQREAAGLLLGRLGNLPALRLATKRHLLNHDDRWESVPFDLAFDAWRRQQELVIELPGDTSISANPFQREFWDLVTAHQWVSISAPTSAGKTRIVTEWIKTLFAQQAELRAAYIAPTRALVQEVSTTLASELGQAVKVHTLPWDADVGQSAKEMYVVTQERMHLLQQRSAFAPSFLFVDEAQNVGDRSRGILLSSVLDEAVHRSPKAQVIFASPLTSNPETLLSGAPADSAATSLLSETVTVNQNLLFVEQVKYKPSRFKVELNIGGSIAKVGEFDIEARRAAPGQRLAFIASALGGGTGNIIYANGPATAEQFANQLWDMLGPSAEIDNEAITNASEFIRASVHDRYALAKVIGRGIGYHYGDIPLPVKTIVEDLFRQGHLKYLVCTSTLLEGVNLPCRNIFLRGPRKGRGNPMTAADFWNLGGRAGRWGSEFQGNIVCIDVNDKAQWPTPPGPRARGAIRKSAELVLDQPMDLVRYIRSGAPPASKDVSEDLEAAFSFIAGRRADQRSLASLYGLALNVEQTRPVEELVDDVMSAIQVPTDVIRRHQGISPSSMQRLLEALRQRQEPQELALVPPEDDEAAAVYKEALDWVSAYLGGPFENDKRRFALSRTIVNWMNGLPLSRLIDYRLRWKRNQGQQVNTAATIREVMSDVEKIARFHAPKFLACFNDVVSVRLGELGLSTEEQPDITMMLELGVPRLTDMGLINAGLSRASAMAVSPYISDPDLNSGECLTWLRERDVETLGIPAFALREIAQLLTSESPIIGEV